MTPADIAPEERALLLRLAEAHARLDGMPVAYLSEADWLLFRCLEARGLAHVPSKTLYRPPLWVDITEAGLAEARR